MLWLVGECLEKAFFEQASQIDCLSLFGNGIARLVFVAYFFMFLSFGIANATLWDRGGGLIYDDVLDVTWLQDANYAQTSGFDADGKITWHEAMAWAENLSYYDPVRNTYWTDWRLPQTLPINGSSFNLALEAYNKGPTRVRNQLARGVQVEGIYSNAVGDVSSEFDYILAPDSAGPADNV